MEATTLVDEVARHAATLTTERLEAEITEGASHVAAATCRWLLYVAEFDRREGWGAWECRSCAHWLSWHCGISLRAAKDQVRVARRLGAELAQITEAFATGRVSYSKVRAMVRVATPDNEAELLELARWGTATQLERACAAYRQILDGDSAEPDADLPTHRLTWRSDGDDVVFTGRLPRDLAEVVIAALEAGTPPPEPTEPVQGGPRNGDRQSLAARRALALVEVAERALSSGPADHDGTERYQVVLHADVDTVAGADPHGHYDSGPPISSDTLRRLLCDCGFVTLLEGLDGEPLNSGRRTRRPNRRIRRALKARDKGCRFPGCGSTWGLHAHHLHHWVDGGETRIENLVLLCRFHHTAVHEGGYRLDLVDDTYLWRRPDGSVITTLPTPWTDPRRVERDNNQLGLQIDPTTLWNEWDGTTRPLADLVDKIAQPDRIASRD